MIPVDVMPSVKAAIAPLDLGPDWPDQAQSLRDTLASYTCDNARAGFNEANHGRLKTGMAADVVVMSHDLSSLQPEDITTAEALTTIKDGMITFQRP